mmetsp:Transcript_62739/g.194238  ORF Transcript_62739/g.194238 Transcript_62739/m.194238 type:complete len:207 (+) Transcript_62739:380-1000(+)
MDELLHQVRCRRRQARGGNERELGRPDDQHQAARRGGWGPHPAHGRPLLALQGRRPLGRQGDDERVAQRHGRGGRAGLLGHRWRQLVRCDRQGPQRAVEHFLSGHAVPLLRRHAGEPRLLDRRPSAGEVPRLLRQRPHPVVRPGLDGRQGGRGEALRSVEAARGGGRRQQHLLVQRHRQRRLDRLLQQLRVVQRRGVVQGGVLLRR